MPSSPAIANRPESRCRWRTPLPIHPEEPSRLDTELDALKTDVVTSGDRRGRLVSVIYRAEQGRVRNQARSTHSERFVLDALIVRSLPLACVWIQSQLAHWVSQDNMDNLFHQCRTSTGVRLRRLEQDE